MSIFSMFPAAPVCYDKTHIDSIIAGLVTLESGFASPKLLLNTAAGGPFTNGTTYANIVGLTNVLFTVPSTGSPTWNIFVYLSYFHDRNTCGLELRANIDGTAIGVTHLDSPNLAAGASPPAIYVQNNPIAGTANQGNRLLTIDFRRSDIFAGCVAGVVVSVSVIRVLVFGFPQ